MSVIPLQTLTCFYSASTHQRPNTTRMSHYVFEDSGCRFTASIDATLQNLQAETLYLLITAGSVAALN